MSVSFPSQTRFEARVLTHAGRVRGEVCARSITGPLAAP
jgi:hypothetical protein